MIILTCEDNRLVKYNISESVDVKLWAALCPYDYNSHVITKIFSDDNATSIYTNIVSRIMKHIEDDEQL